MDAAIGKLVIDTTKLLREQGLSRYTVDNYLDIFSVFEKYCDKNRIFAYNDEIGAQFLLEQFNHKPPFSRHHLSICRSAIKRLDCVFFGQEFIKGPFGRKPVAYETSKFNEIRDEYRIYLEKTRKTPKDVRSRILCVSRFLKFVDDRGIESLLNLSATDIHDAFHEASDKCRFRRLVGHFLVYAYKYGLTKEDLYSFMPTPIRHKPIPSVYSTEEVETIIQSISTDTNTGKRNYAIVLIDARLGIRASDIAGLTFDSIIKSEKKLRIKRQQKTKNPLILPLPDEVMAAINDYIDHARQSSTDEHIFLNIANDKAISPANVGKIVEMAITASGIDTAGKRKGSHSLRSSLATSLIEEGISYSAVQQVLGHSDIRSTKAYVKVSAETLRTCALSVPEPSKIFRKLLMEGV